MDYRREIDGLRALAVLSVLCFHFWPDHLPYGYLGVDVFFVISGFLITLYILDGETRGEFRFRAFYLRRVKRILPVTIFVLMATSIAALGVLIGSDIDGFLTSLTASLTFTANVFFWRDGGYFGSNDALKPLLHLWSLSVEEQFYLVFPLVFVLVFRYVGNYTGRVLLFFGLAAASLLASFFLIQAGGDNPAFFLTPFRAWEFGAGTLSALYFFSRNKPHTPATLLCAVLLIVSGLVLDSGFIVPGFLAVLGTALFLSRSYLKLPLVDLYFDSSMVIKIGLISFSLYLWHWPVLVFLRYISVDEPNPWLIGSAFILTFVLSAFSYRFIEQPFRQAINPRVTMYLALASTIWLIAGSSVLLNLEWHKNTADLANRIASSIQTNYRCEISDYRPYGASRACVINGAKHADYSVVLMGNSHAQMYTPELVRVLSRQGESGLLVPLNGCLPTIDVNTNADCLRLSKINLDAVLADVKVKSVIFALTWYQKDLVGVNGKSFVDSDGSALAAAILNVIDKVTKAGKAAYLVGPIKIPDYDLPSVLSRKLKFGELKQSQIHDLLRVEKRTFNDDYNELIALFRNKLGTRFVAPSDVLCDKQFCYFGDDQGVYFSDGNHLSAYGISRLGGIFDAFNLYAKRP